jgi:hypothetical protein
MNAASSNHCEKDDDHEKEMKKLRISVERTKLFVA